MNFGHALELLKKGAAVSRSGWNGKGMFLFLIGAGTITHPALEAERPALPYIAMSTVNGFVVPWFASQADLLAEDWQEAPEAAS